MTQNFYQDLKPLSSFDEAMDIGLHTDLPDDWVVIISDVRGSTKAIEQGRYKDVNTVGVACIAAVMNVDRGTELPYVFGGDGATFAVPAKLAEKATNALLGARRMAQNAFKLDLRIGRISAQTLRAQNHWLKIAKLQLSSSVSQPAFSGRGWEIAEEWIKAATADSGLLAVDDGRNDYQADFSGFECRWRAVESFKDHKLTLLVAATPTDPLIRMQVYREVNAKIKDIYGDDHEHHPLRASALELGLQINSVLNESKVRSFQAPSLKTLDVIAYAARAIIQNLVGRMLFFFKVKTKDANWGNYKNEVVQNTDHKKFDGVLRQVLDGDESQSQTLVNFLEAERHGGRLVYGVHKSSAALVTCIVRNHKEDHAHFVDGSDGGYALAAKMMKSQLRGR